MNRSVESRLSTIESDLEKLHSRETDQTYLDDSGNEPAVIQVTGDLHARFPGPGREDTDLATLPRYSDHFPNQNSNAKEA